MDTIELRIRLNYSRPLSPYYVQQVVDKTYELIEGEAEEGGVFAIDENEVSDFGLEHECIDDA